MQVWRIADKYCETKVAGGQAGKRWIVKDPTTVSHF